jgi:hypothetical protein
LDNQTRFDRQLQSQLNQSAGGLPLHRHLAHVAFTSRASARLDVGYCANGCPEKLRPDPDDPAIGVCPRCGFHLVTAARTAVVYGEPVRPSDWERQARDAGRRGGQASAIARQQQNAEQAREGKQE